MMLSVPGRASSPTIIGRGIQLDALRSAVAGIADDPRRIVLVHGEAGIGKTRLLDEFARSIARDPVADRPTLLLRGTCLELGGGDLPYAPILDILDALAAEVDAPAQRSVVLGLRDELGGAGATDVVSSGRGRTFIAIRDALLAAADGSHVVVCIDDLHWADRSTLELIRFLSTRVGRGTVLFVLAYRSDEIRRGHPLRPVLAELERGSIAADVALEPLGRAQVREQLAAILGTSAGTADLERIVALADGNPFHAEELAALDVDANELPRSLRDVLLARLDRLDDAGLGLLGRAAVIGRDIDEGLLIAVSDRSEADVRAALRQAIDLHVLEPTPDGRRQRFRHALLREAVLGDLLPMDRVQLHRTIAQTLEARPEFAAGSPAAAAAELAYHWSEAGDTERAFPALVEAGRRAQAAHAWTEASEAFEHAAKLATADRALLPPIDLAELWMDAAWLADFVGNPRRGLELGRSAAAADDGSDPRRSGALLGRLSSLANDAGDFELAGSAVERAVVLIPAEPPSVERAHAVLNLAGRRMERSRCREAIVLADEAFTLCMAIGAPVHAGAARSVRAISTASLGRVDETRLAIDQSMALFRSNREQAVFEAGSIIANDAAALWVIGDHEEVMPFVDEAMAWAAEIGAERGWSVWLEASAAHALLGIGDWRGAAERLDRFRAEADASYPLMDALLVAAQLAAGRGDRSQVEDLVSRESEARASDAYAAMFSNVRAVAALWDDDARSATGYAEIALVHLARIEEFTFLAESLDIAARAYADLAERHRASRNVAPAEMAAARAEGLAQDATRLAAGTYREGASSTPWMRALALEAVAEAGRAAGRSDPASWGAAAAAHAAVGTIPDVAYDRYREGEAHLVAGDGSAALVALTEARAIAVRVGITPLIARIDVLARRGRLKLDAAAAIAPSELPDAPLDPWGLSPREREVLTLVAAGRTNRQIGETLFISDKTASVHVTHILDKLGVSSRTEAALLAGRSGLTDPDPVVEPPAQVD